MRGLKWICQLTMFVWTLSSMWMRLLLFGCVWAAFGCVCSCLEVRKTVLNMRLWYLYEIERDRDRTQQTIRSVQRYSLFVYVCTKTTPTIRSDQRYCVFVLVYSCVCERDTNSMFWTTILLVLCVCACKRNTIRTFWTDSYVFNNDIIMYVCVCAQVTCSV